MPDAAYVFCWAEDRRPFGGGPRGDLRARVEAELGEDALDVRINGALGDDQLFGNLAVGATLGNTHRDLAFAGS